MVDPAQGVATTTVSIEDVGVDHHYMDKDISCDQRHAPPPSVRCDSETRVLGKRY